jgi:hypothetical protein
MMAFGRMMKKMDLAKKVIHMMGPTIKGFLAKEREKETEF